MSNFNKKRERQGFQDKGAIEAKLQSPKLFGDKDQLVPFNWKRVDV